MNHLYPKFPRNSLPVMIRITALGAIVAGCYGAVHDQISYTISTEYFTKIKFRQFAYADFGLPPRVFASEVGFLAAWWVGMLAGWFVARAGLAEMPAPNRRRHIVRAFGIVIGTAAAAGLVGTFLGATVGADSFDVAELRAAGIDDPSSFLVVAYLHAGGYAGAAIGLLLAILYVRRSCSKLPSAAQSD